MIDIDKLVAGYRKILEAAINQSSNSADLEKKMNEQLCQLASKSGPNGQPLFSANKLAGPQANYECPPGWKHCAGVGCVPDEVGCEGEQA